MPVKMSLAACELVQRLEAHGPEAEDNAAVTAVLFTAGGKTRKGFEHGEIALLLIVIAGFITEGFRLAFEPDPAIAAPLRFAESSRLHLAGFAYPDSLERLAGTPYALAERVGSGHIVLFLDDPNFRIYWQGLSRLFLNSLVLSPSF